MSGNSATSEPQRPTTVKSLHEDEAELTEDHRHIDELIINTTPRYGLDPRLLHAMAAVESRFNPRAVSRRGAKGAFQMIEGTAVRFGVRNILDPRENLEGALRYLSFLRGLYGEHRLDLMLAAYNAGENSVANFGGIPPFAETKQYVRAVLRLYRDHT